MSIKNRFFQSATILATAGFFAFGLEHLASAAEVIAPTVTPDMLSYSRTRYALYFIGFVWSVGIFCLMLFQGWAARMRDLAESRFRNRFVQVAAFYIMFSATFLLLRLPLSFYSGFLLDHQYGLSHQSIGLWLTDLAKTYGVTTAIAVPGYAGLLWIIKRFPRSWAGFVWLASSLLIAAGIFLHPLVFDPLYNKFTPMPPSPLRSQIEQLATQAGIAGAPIFVVDSSRRTAKLNAYVTGLGSSHRIVLWDNLINKLPAEQVLAIIGHEIGHYVLHHIYWGFGISVLASACGLALLQFLGEPLRRRLPAAWGIRSLHDLTIIPAAALGSLLLALVTSPVESAISRAMEHQADAYGLQLTQNGPAMARSFISLSERNLSEPNPPKWIVFWFFSHPPLQERIDFALKTK
jgi:STE24 endopeptidase